MPTVARATCGGLFFAAMLAPWASGQPFLSEPPLGFNPPVATGATVPQVVRSGLDWDGDGHRDLAVRWFPQFYLLYPGRFRIHSGSDFSVVFERVALSLAPCGTGFDHVGESFDFGDVTGDGSDDLLLATPTASMGGSCLVGKVEAMAHGTGQMFYTVWGENVGDGFGEQVEAVGDTNGNGISDFLVQAPGYPTPASPNSGAVYLIEGGDGSVIHLYVGSGGNDYGTTTILAGLGDIDQDGFPDYGITRTAGAFSGVPGHATIYSGYSPSTVVRDHVALPEDQGFCHLAFFTAGDGDGDGAPEYVIGNLAFGWQGTFSLPTPGRAWLYSGATGMVLTTFIPPPGVWWFGGAGAALEDLDGDGFREVVFSSPRYNPTWTPPGSPSVHIYSGGTGLLMQTIPSPSPPVNQWGSRVAAVGDGWLDFAVIGGFDDEVSLYNRGFATVSPDPVSLGGTATFTVSFPSEAGSAFHLCFAGSSLAGIPLGTRHFPLDPDLAFLVTAQAPQMGGLLDASGQATIGIPVPVDPSLSGVAVQYAPVILAPAFPFGVKWIGSVRSVTVQ